MQGQRIQMAGDLRWTVEQRDQVRLLQHGSIASHVSREDIDIRARPQDRPQRRTFGRKRYEKAAYTGIGKRRGHAVQAQAIGVRLDRRAGFDGHGAERVERAPVFGDRLQIDDQLTRLHFPLSLLLCLCRTYRATAGLSNRRLNLSVGRRDPRRSIGKEV